MLIGMIDIAHAMAPGQPGGAGQGAQGLFGSLIPLILIFVIFYFLLIRPQQKRSKEHKNMIENLKKGDKVVTSGGVYGVIEAIGTNTVTLKIAENVRVKFGKSYIAALRVSADED
jgi:preprotein translocase subunit YajC